MLISQQLQQQVNFAAFCHEQGITDFFKFALLCSKVIKRANDITLDHNRKMNAAQQTRAEARDERQCKEIETLAAELGFKTLFPSAFAEFANRYGKVVHLPLTHS